MRDSMEATLAEIEKMSTRLRGIITAALFLLPLFWAGDILQALAVGYVDYGAPDKRIPLSSMPLWLEATAALLRAVELLPIAGALLTLRELLGDWCDGAIFTPVTIEKFRRVGMWLVLLAGVDLATSLVLGPLVWAAGIATFAVHLNLNLAALLIGVLVMLLSRIMRVGVRLQEQADLTI